MNVFLLVILFFQIINIQCFCHNQGESILKEIGNTVLVPVYNVTFRVIDFQNGEQRISQGYSVPVYLSLVRSLYRHKKLV